MLWYLWNIQKISTQNNTNSLAVDVGPLRKYGINIQNNMSFDVKDALRTRDVSIEIIRDVRLLQHLYFHPLRG